MIQRASILFLEILAGLLLLVAIAAGVAAWRLSEGPIRVDALNPLVGEILSDPGLGLNAEVGTTEVTWSGWERAFDLIARDLVLRDTGGDVAATVEAVSVSLRGSALLQGRLVPERIEVIEPSITVRRHLDGHWSLVQSAQGDELAGREFDLQTLLEPLARGPETGSEGAVASLISLTVRAAQVKLVDQIREKTFRLEGVDAELERAPGGLAFAGEARALWSSQAVSSLRLDGSYRAETGALNVRMDVRDVPAADLAKLDPVLHPLSNLTGSLSGSADLVIPMHRPVPAGRIEITTGAGRLELPERFPEPVPIAGANLALTLEEQGAVVRLDGSVDLEGPLLAVNGRLARGGTGWGVLVDAALSNMALNALPGYWPFGLGSGAREWVTGNLRDGRVETATLRLQGWMDGFDAGTLQVDTVDGRIEFEDVATHFFRPLPPVTGSEGWASFDADSFDIQILSGTLRGLRVTEGSSVLISNIGAERSEIASVDLSIQGPLADALWLLDHEPLGYAARFGLDPEAVEGLAGARVRFEIPLLKDLSVDEIKVGAAASMSGVSIPDVVGSVGLAEAELELDLTGGGMTVAGHGKLLGRDAEVSITEVFVDGQGVKSHQQLATRIDSAGLARLGLDTGGRMTGLAAVAIDRETTWDDETVLSVEADLQDAGLLVPELGWRKQQQTAGVMRARLALRDGVPQRLLAFALTTGDLAVEAVADFDDRGAFLSADLSEFRLGRTQAAGRVERHRRDGWRIGLNGPVIDLAPILERGEDAGEGSGEDCNAAGTLEVRLFADALFLEADRPAIDGAALAVRLVDERIEQLGLKGRIGEGEVSVAVDPLAAGRRFSLRATDAGDFLRAFDVVDAVQGGTLRADGWLLGDGLDDAFDIVAQIDEFRVVDAPAFAKLLSSASFTGLNDILSGAGIRFARARGRMIVDRGTAEIEDALAYGPGLGLKLDGRFERKTETIRMIGLLAPAYSLSRLIDTIPVLGELLTGGEGEGLLATEFRLDGPLDDPAVAINPLTALAPGFLRGLVSTAENEELLPPSNAPAPGAHQPEDLGR